MTNGNTGETAVGEEIVETRDQIREHADNTGLTDSAERVDPGEIPAASRGTGAKNSNPDLEMSEDADGHDRSDVSELDRMDTMLSDAMEQLYHKAAGDGRIRDEQREELRLKMLKAMSTLARTRLQVYETKELEDMRAELEALLSEADNDETSIGQPTEIEHVIGGDER